LIGVAAALLISRAPMGFVAILGVVSLIGMVIRNSVILIGQIDTEIAAGLHPWNAVIVATEHRLRPILLTAAAAILGMLSIAPNAVCGSLRCSRLFASRRCTWRGFASLHWRKQTGLRKNRSEAAQMTCVRSRLR